MQFNLYRISLRLAIKELKAAYIHPYANAQNSYISSQSILPRMAMTKRDSQNGFRSDCKQFKSILLIYFTHKTHRHLTEL